MLKNTSADTSAPAQTALETAIPTQFMEMINRSMRVTPEIWRESCEVFAEAASDRAALLHDMAKADSPITASAILTKHWQEACRKSFDRFARIAQLDQH